MWLTRSQIRLLSGGLQQADPEHRGGVQGPHEQAPPRTRVAGKAGGVRCVGRRREARRERPGRQPRGAVPLHGVPVGLGGRPRRAAVVGRARGLCPSPVQAPLRDVMRDMMGHHIRMKSYHKLAVVVLWVFPASTGSVFANMHCVTNRAQGHIIPAL